MIEREEFERRSAELIEKTSTDIANFRAMFDASTEGMIRMMLLLWYVKTTLPGIFDHVDEAGKMTALWLAIGSPEDQNSDIFTEMLREFEGTKH